MVCDICATQGEKYIVCQENLGKLRENQTWKIGTLLLFKSIFISLEWPFSSILQS